MNADLIDQVEGLSQVSIQSKAGDISTLAELLEKTETMRQFSEINGIPDLVAPLNGLADYIKFVIMGEQSNDEESMKVIRDAISLMQEAIIEGNIPPVSAYSPLLKISGDGSGGSSEMDTEIPVPTAGTIPAATESGDRQGDLIGSTEDEITGISQEMAQEDDGSEGEAAFAADKELLAEYLEEQKTRLEEIEGNLLSLENEDNEGALADLRRALHTIKGDSGFLGLSEVVQITHEAETFLEESSPPFDLENLFAVKDWLARAFEDLTSNGNLSPGTKATQSQLMGKLGSQAQSSSGEEIKTPPLEVEPDAGSLQSQPDLPEDVSPLEASASPSGGKISLSADESLLVDFISESKEHLEEATAQLLSLENDPGNEESINSVFRAFHTLKGIAGFLNLDEIKVLAHDTENLLDLVRRREVELTPSLTDLVFEALDWMTRLINNIGDGLQSDGMLINEPDLIPFIEKIKFSASTKGNGGGVPGPPTSKLGEILVKSGAVDRNQMDDAIEEAKIFEPEKKIGEVLVEKNLVSSETVNNALKEQHQERVQASRKAVELKETLRVDYARLENMINTIGELVLAESMINQDEVILDLHSENLTKKLYNLRQVSRKLQELGTTIRMIPISGTFQKMARLTRDLSRKSGKPVLFTSKGDETELDRAYVDLIADPLVHMVRNAVDHGIETPQERVKAGKPEEGNVHLRAYHEGGNIHVEISDDGKGLDQDAIYNKALEKGLISEDEKMTEQEIFHLIFLPGFSTASSVTEVSGRGVGMDVVRRNIKELRGQVAITSELGAGTSFKIILPLTLALIDGMLVKSGDERFIFPVLSVVESIRPTQKMLSTIIGKGEMISLRNRQLPLYRLYKLFNIENAKEDIEDCLVVIVENDGRQIGIIVDDLIGMQQTVIKNLGQGLIDTRGLSGGSIMADGTVGLIVDIPGLMSIARGSEKSDGEQVQIIGLD